MVVYESSWWVRSKACGPKPIQFQVGNRKKADSSYTLGCRRKKHKLPQA